MDRTYQINEFSVTRTQRRKFRIRLVLVRALALIAFAALLVANA